MSLILKYNNLRHDTFAMAFNLLPKDVKELFMTEIFSQIEKL